MPRNNNIQFRRGTYSEWDAVSTGILASGEPGIVTDYLLLKVGDGTTQWSDLSAINDHLTTIVRNDTLNTINKMSVVYISGAQGDLPSISLSIASGESISGKTYGILVDNILSGNIGQVTVEGTLRNLDTLTQFSGVTPGTTLWLSPTISGGITTTKPYAPNHMVAVGTLIRVHQTQGVINVKIQNGFELEELHNVATTGATNGQFLQYNSATGLWVPSSSGNFTTLRVNGTGVSVSGHSHVVNDITDFSTGVADEVSTTITAGTGINLSYDSGNDTLTVSVSGLINNPTNNRILTSRDNTTTGIDAESNLTFDGTTFVCSGNARIGDSQYIDVNNGVVFIRSEAGSMIINCEEALLHDANGAVVSLDFNQRYLYDSAQNNVLSWYEPNKIGIRNTNPSYNLDVNGSGNFASGLAISNQTANTIASFDSNKNVISLSTGTYPSLTELSYVKGVTSALQTQLNSKQNTLTNPVTGTGVASHIAYWNSSSGIVADSGQLYWDATNNRLGIGTSSPSYTLDVAGDAEFGVNNSLRFVDTGGGNSRMVFAGAGSVDCATNFTFRNNAGTVEYARFDTAGRLGIGTNSPTSSLTVSGIIQLTDTAGNRVQFFRGGGTQYDYSIAKEGNHLAVSTANDGSTFRYTQFGYHSGSTWTPKTVINNYNGNVGIINTTPSYQLDVTGSGHFTQNVVIDGDCVIGPLKAYKFNGNAWGYDRIVFRSDVNNKITSDASGNYNWLVAGRNWTLSDVGKAGIGTSSPSYKLDVVGTGNFSQNLLVNGISVRNTTLSFFTALDNQPPASNFATLDTRNSIAVLDFDDTTEESAVFIGVAPPNASLASGISVRIHWMATSATSGNCRWGVQFEDMNTDEDSDSFDTATEAHSATNGTAGIPTTTTITCTTIDSIAAGDFFRIKIYRDVSDTTNDTMTGDAELIAVEVRSVL